MLNRVAKKKYITKKGTENYRKKEEKKGRRKERKKEK